MIFEEALPEIRKMPLVFGGIVKLEDIVGRDKKVDDVIYTLNSTSVNINEIRRFGKTSFLRLLESRAPDNWICVNNTVQDARSTAELIDLTLRGILNHSKLKDRMKKTILDTWNALKNAKIKISELEISSNITYKADPLSTFRSVLNSVGKQLIEDKKIMVIIWDEFPDAIHTIMKKEGKDAAKEILMFFRALRQSGDSQNIRWVLTGSIGLHHILRELSGNVITNDILPVSLDPLEQRYIRWMAQCLLLEINKNLEGSDYLADVSGGIPFILAMMVKYINDTDTHVPQSLADAKKLFIDAASDLNLAKGWAPLLERVGIYYGRNKKSAETILDIIASGPVDESNIKYLLREKTGKDISDSTLETVLKLLEEDHYIKYENSSRLYTWKHEPLRIIWNVRRRKG